MNVGGPQWLPAFPAVTQWRTSTFSQVNGTCVEMADLPDGRVAIRNSTDPDGTTVVLTRPGYWPGSAV